MRPSRNNLMALYQKPLHIRSEPGNGLRGLFEEELKDLLWVEKTLTRAFPKMVRHASSSKLKEVLTNHLDETEEQITRLVDVFSNLGMKAQAIKCEGIEGLLRDIEILINSVEEGPVRDAAIISSCQKIEHYQIASYNTLCSYARTLGEEEVYLLLDETLKEEKNTINKLNSIPFTDYNYLAATAY